MAAEHRISIFTIPKAFKEDAERIQRNAISSWSRLPEVEIILIGNDAGVEGVARDFGAVHVPEVDTSPFGTPLVSSAFDLARQHASSPLLCFVNADIILFSDLSSAAAHAVSLERFLLTGRRSDLAVPGSVEDFSEAAYRDFEKTARSEAELGPPFAMDYFMFPRVIEWEMPRFIVGRPGWDNWMIFEARQRGFPVIDASDSVFALHQAHDYGHVPQQRGSKHDGPETDANLDLITPKQMHSLHHATHLLSRGKIHPAVLRRCTIKIKQIYHAMAGNPEGTSTPLVRTWRRIFGRVSHPRKRS